MDRSFLTTILDSITQNPFSKRMCKARFLIISSHMVDIITFHKILKDFNLI